MLLTRICNWLFRTLIVYFVFCSVILLICLLLVFVSWDASILFVFFEWSMFDPADFGMRIIFVACMVISFVISCYLALEEPLEDKDNLWVRYFTMLRKFYEYNPKKQNS